MSHADELLAAFNKAKQPKQQIAAVEQIIKSYEQFKEPEKQLQPIVVAVENAAARNQKLHPELAFQLIIARDDLLALIPSLHTTHIGLTLSKLIMEEEKRLTLILPNLPAAKEKRVLQALPSALGAGWTERALRAHGSKSRSNGGANSAHLERNRATRRASDDAGAKHSRTFSHERDAHLVMRRKRGLGRPDYP